MQGVDFDAITGILGKVDPASNREAWVSGFKSDCIAFGLHPQSMMFGHAGRVDIPEGIIHNAAFKRFF